MSVQEIKIATLKNPKTGKFYDLFALVPRYTDVSGNEQNLVPNMSSIEARRSGKFPTYLEALVILNTTNLVPQGLIKDTEKLWHIHDLNSQDATKAEYAVQANGKGDRPDYARYVAVKRVDLD